MHGCEGSLLDFPRCLSQWRDRVPTRPTELLVEAVCSTRVERHLGNPWGEAEKEPLSEGLVIIPYDACFIIKLLLSQLTFNARAHDINICAARATSHC